MNKTEIKDLVKSEIKKYIIDSLDSEVKKLLKKQNSESRSEIISTIKNSLDAVYKVLWQKKDYWKTEIK